MEKSHSAKDKLLDAALSIFRRRGYSATTVDDLCAEAKVTKGAFFHHFRSKESLATAAADHWSVLTDGFFATAGYHRHVDPLDRILGYLECRKQLLRGDLAEFTCLVGTLVQETYETAPAIRKACERSITGHAAVLESDIDAAMKLYDIQPEFTAKSLALYSQSVIQGAFVLAKATQSREIAADSIDHLHRYVKSLFKRRD